MHLLETWIGNELSTFLSDTSDDEHPRRQRDDESPNASPRILWATQMGDAKLILVDEHPRRLLVIRSFADRSTALGNVKIAELLMELGILREESRNARHALPREILDEFPTLSTPRQLSLEFPVRAAG